MQDWQFARSFFLIVLSFGALPAVATTPPSITRAPVGRKLRARQQHMQPTVAINKEEYHMYGDVALFTLTWWCFCASGDFFPAFWVGVVGEQVRTDMVDVLTLFHLCNVIRTSPTPEIAISALLSSFFFGFESETARALYALTSGLTVVFPPGGGGPGLQVAQQNMSSVYFFNFGSYCPRSVATEKERAYDGRVEERKGERKYVCEPGCGAIK